MAYQPGADGRYAVPLVDFGNRLQNRFGLRVREHPQFGGVSPVHSPNSYHHYGEAIDITDYRPDVIDGVSWQQRTANLRDRLRGAGPEVIGPGDMEGHDTHLHLAAKGGVLSLSPEQYRYFYGDQAGGRKATFTPMRFADVSSTPETIAREDSVSDKAGDNEVIAQVKVDEPEKIDGTIDNRDFFRDAMKQAMLGELMNEERARPSNSTARAEIAADMRKRRARMANAPSQVPSPRQVSGFNEVLQAGQSFKDALAKGFASGQRGVING